jgi:hypothetical protein
MTILRSMVEASSPVYVDFARAASEALARIVDCLALLRRALQTLAQRPEPQTRPMRL